jgi:hypothetical protein
VRSGWHFGCLNTTCGILGSHLNIEMGKRRLGSTAHREREDLWWRSMASDNPGGRAVMPSGPRAALGCGASSGPTHEDQLSVGCAVTGACSDGLPKVEIVASSG